MTRALGIAAALFFLTAVASVTAAEWANGDSLSTHLDCTAAIMFFTAFSCVCCLAAVRGADDEPQP